VLLAGLVIACAHAAPETPAPAAKKPPRIETGENQTDPVRSPARAPDRRFPRRDVRGVVRATYLVTADGKVTEVKVTARDPPERSRPSSASSRAARTRPPGANGKPVAVRWRGDLDFNGR